MDASRKWASSTTSAKKRSWKAVRRTSPSRRASGRAVSRCASSTERRGLVFEFCRPWRATSRPARSVGAPRRAEPRRGEARETLDLLARRVLHGEFDALAGGGIDAAHATHDDTLRSVAPLSASKKWACSGEICTDKTSPARTVVRGPSLAINVDRRANSRCTGSSRGARGC